MYCNSIGQSYNPENAIVELFDLSPEPYSAIPLSLDTYRMLYRTYAELT
jgi:hypothetical protein